MRALFMKDIVILMFFLSAGLTGLTLVAVELGYDKAFVIPTLRIPEEMVGFWIAFGVLLGDVAGFDGLDPLVGLLNQARPHGNLGLLEVPRTPILGSPQTVHNGQKHAKGLDPRIILGHGGQGPTFEGVTHDGGSYK